MATAYDELINQLYQEQLGRAPDVAGAEYWASQLAGGASQQDVLNAINRSLEGQNFDTQYITSLYRQNLARNPEQAGFQYWLSEAQKAGYTPEQIQANLVEAAKAEQSTRGITPGTAFTDMQLAALEADPYGGRYATQSIYDLLPDAVNVSRIGDLTAQFVSPVTQQPVVSTYGTDGSQWTQNAGLDVLNAPAVQAAISRALSSGTMDQADYNTLVQDLTTARNVDDMYAAFNKPQGQVVIDAIYGQQTGEAKTLAEAQAEAAQRQAVLDAVDTGYYQGNFPLADAYTAAGLNYPFGRDAYTGYDTRTGEANVINDSNFNAQINNLLKSMTQQFGSTNSVDTPLTGQYYSEAGLQPGYTPVGTPGTTFRSGVAGYIPQSQLPTRFDFGAPPVNATFQQYRPGAFQPAGVTTGGFITGYTQEGTPIYSTYNNPNVNVGGATSALNPFNRVDANAIAQLQEYVANQQAAAAQSTNNYSGGG